MLARGQDRRARRGRRHAGDAGGRMLPDGVPAAATHAGEKWQGAGGRGQEKASLKMVAVVWQASGGGVQRIGEASRCFALSGWRRFAMLGGVANGPFVFRMAKEDN